MTVFTTSKPINEAIVGRIFCLAVIYFLISNQRFFSRLCGESASANGGQRMIVRLEAKPE